MKSNGHWIKGEFLESRKVLESYCSKQITPSQVAPSRDAISCERCRRELDLVDERLLFLKIDRATFKKVEDLTNELFRLRVETTEKLAKAEKVLKFYASGMHDNDSEMVRGIGVDGRDIILKGKRARYYLKYGEAII